MNKPVEIRAGCKVGWETFTDEAAARARAETAATMRDRKLARGYDFGYLWPGTVQHVADHPEHGECWIVTVP